MNGLLCIFLLGIIWCLLQAVVLDQGFEADLVADIQKYLEDLISAGLRHRLISLMKVFALLPLHFYSQE